MVKEQNPFTLRWPFDTSSLHLPQCLIFTWSLRFTVIVLATGSCNRWLARSASTSIGLRPRGDNCASREGAFKILKSPSQRQQPVRGWGTKYSGVHHDQGDRLWLFNSDDSRRFLVNRSVKGKDSSACLTQIPPLIHILTLAHVLLWHPPSFLGEDQLSDSHQQGNQSNLTKLWRHPADKGLNKRTQPLLKIPHYWLWGWVRIDALEWNVWNKPLVVQQSLWRLLSRRQTF